MIKANELRIGNYLLMGGRIIKISGILKNGFYFGEHGYATNIINWFEPISLTEEWLLKFGFEKTNNPTLYSHKSVCMKHNTTSYYPVAFDDGGAFSIGKNIQYVHQLQNLYFALTGEELNPTL